MLCYFVPKSRKEKKTVPSRIKLALPINVLFLGCHYVSLPTCGLCFTVSQPDLCLHHHIPYLQAVPSVIQSIQMLEWALPASCFQAADMLVRLVLWAAAILALCLLMSVLNELWRQHHHFEHAAPVPI